MEFGFNIFPLLELSAVDAMQMKYMQCKTTRVDGQRLSISSRHVKRLSRHKQASPDLTAHDAFCNRLSLCARDVTASQ